MGANLSDRPTFERDQQIAVETTDRTWRLTATGETTVNARYSFHYFTTAAGHSATMLCINDEPKALDVRANGRTIATLATVQIASERISPSHHND